MTRQKGEIVRREERTIKGKKQKESEFRTEKEERRKTGEGRRVEGRRRRWRERNRRKANTGDEEGRGKGYRREASGGRETRQGQEDKGRAR